MPLKGSRVPRGDQTKTKELLMSLLPPLRTKKTITLILVVGIAFLLAASLSQTVEGGVATMRFATPKKGNGVVTMPEGQPSKSRRFPNVDIRSTERRTMSDIAAANAGSI